MNIHDARSIAAAHIGEGIRRAQGFIPIILDVSTMELPWGWVFFYDSQEYINTRNIIHALAGNAPIVVDRNGNVYETGSSRPLAQYLVELEARTKT